MSYILLFLVGCGLVFMCSKRSPEDLKKAAASDEKSKVECLAKPTEKTFITEIDGCRVFDVRAPYYKNGYCSTSSFKFTKCANATVEYSCGKNCTESNATN